MAGRAVSHTSQSRRAKAGSRGVQRWKQEQRPVRVARRPLPRAIPSQTGARSPAGRGRVGQISGEL